MTTTCELNLLTDRNCTIVVSIGFHTSSQKSVKNIYLLISEHTVKQEEEEYYYCSSCFCVVS